MHKYNIYYKATPPECEGQLTPTAASSSSSNVIDFEHLSASFPDTFGVEYRALQERRRTWSDIRRKRREIDDEADRMDLDDGGGDDATAKSSFSTHVTPSFVLALSSCLLRRDFGLEHFDVPAGRLCPPVPGRLNYICWLRELLEESRGGGGKLCAAPDDNGQEHGRIESRLDTKRRRKFVSEEKEEEQIIGIDIGTGSSAIFPLLGVRQFWREERTMDAANMNMNTNTAPNSRRRRRPPWYFLATDVDPIALASARHNVASNGMSHRISVLAARPDVGPVRAAMEAAAAASARPPLRYDFCMTNPPFYSDAAEATEPRRGDARPRTDMCAVESVYGGGGEVGFVSNMIDDSLVYREAIGWYTSMLGKKSSLVEILRVLKAKGFGRGNVQTTQFVQGRSVRWGIAWTFREGPARTLECKLATRRFVAASNPDTDNDLPPSEEEIVKRLLQYYTTVSTDNVRISPMRSSDEDGNCIITFVGHSCPKVDIGLISKEERWLTIDVTVHASRLPDGSNNCTNAVATALNVECYVYVDAGKKIALGIVDRMEGEVFRTNRRWRRLLSKVGNKGKI